MTRAVKTRLWVQYRKERKEKGSREKVTMRNFACPIPLVDQSLKTQWCYQPGRYLYTDLMELKTAEFSSAVIKYTLCALK